MAAGPGPAQAEVVDSVASFEIEVYRVFKSFGPLPVLRGVNLQVRSGERLLLVGANGSGKTTLIKIMATLSRPSAGRVLMHGFDTQDEADRVRANIGVLSHQTYLYGELTVLENLRFYAQMYGVPDADTRITELLRLVALDAWGDAQVRTLSRGMQQRVALARAVLHHPPILLLDEPDTGLDQRAADVLGDLLATVAAEGRTVVLTSHNLERGLALADRVAVLAGGKIVFEAARDELDAGDLQVAYRNATGVAG